MDAKQGRRQGDERNFNELSLMADRSERHGNTAVLLQGRRSGDLALHELNTRRAGCGVGK